MRYNEFKTEAISPLSVISPTAPDLSMLNNLFGKSNTPASSGMDPMKLFNLDADSSSGNSIDDKIKAKRAGKGSKDSRAVSKSSNAPANVNAIKNYLSSKGLDSNQVAGIMSNIQHESSFRPGVMGDGGTSGGLFQHHAERFTAMRRATGGGDNWKTNWQGQIDFALSEPAGQQYKSLKFSSPEQASRWWTINFEVPQNKYAKADSRSKDASQFA